MCFFYRRIECLGKYPICPFNTCKTSHRKTKSNSRKPTQTSDQYLSDVCPLSRVTKTLTTDVWPNVIRRLCWSSTQNYSSLPSFCRCSISTIAKHLNVSFSYVISCHKSQHSTLIWNRITSNELRTHKSSSSFNDTFSQLKPTSISRQQDTPHLFRVQGLYWFQGNNHT